MIDPQAPTPAPVRGRLIPSQFVWAVAMAIFGIWAAFGRVHTHLGVSAGRFDKDGRETVWRVWWRARNDFISRDSWVIVAFYLLFLFVFISLCAAALWFVLVEGDPAGEHAEEADAL